jgi:hypothetical protein
MPGRGRSLVRPAICGARVNKTSSTSPCDMKCPKRVAPPLCSMIRTPYSSCRSVRIAYTLSNWDALVRYCQYGDLEIDNNGAEPTLRSVAVGRRNWTFFGSDNGGRTAAVLTSLIATCKRHHIDPFAYLRDVFQRIAAHPITQLADLLPDQWLAARTTAA